MTLAQRNYQIYDKEFLAVINALEEWKRYVIGASKTTEIITDHKNLEFYRKPQNLTRLQADWVSKLQEYDVTLSHRPGRLHTQADFLSRPIDVDKGIRDNESITGIPDDIFTSATNIEDILPVLLNDEKAILPTKGSEQAVGHDLYRTQDVEITASGTDLVTTGISFASLSPSTGRIAPRSTLPSILMISIAAGVIIADSRGI